MNLKKEKADLAVIQKQIDNLPDDLLGHVLLPQLMEQALRLEQIIAQEELEGGADPT